MKRQLLGRTILAGTCLWMSAQTASAKLPNSTPPRPNIIVIMADDLGLSDIGAFGGEIRTPNLDQLARDGRRFANFNVAPACSMTRSEVLTGVDHHQTGFGNFAEFITAEQRGKPGYEGNLNSRVVTVAQLLQDGGYCTSMSGKWHLGFDIKSDPHFWGFSNSFAMLNGAHNHFGKSRGTVPDVPFTTTQYRENGKDIDISKLPANFYSSDNFTSKIIEYIDGCEKSKPFFAYLAFSAPHFPLQAPAEDILRYKGRYDAGWEALRSQRLERMKREGIISRDVSAHPMMPDRDAWSKLSPAEKQIESRKMEVYAAMVDRVDQNVGRLIAHLKSTNQYNNTVIWFMSDNGAAGGESNRGKSAAAASMQRILDQSANDLDNIGSERSHVWYGPYWAQAATAPFRLWKLNATEGGIRVVSFLGGAALPGQSRVVDKQYLNSLDVAPTLLSLAGLPAPGPRYKGRTILQHQGQSLVPFLKGQRARVHPANYERGTEMRGERAFRRGDWKVVNVTKPELGGNGWQLFNLASDPGETNDLAKLHPAMLRSMVAGWERYAKQKGVILGRSPL